jgi:hypothetical protein
MEGKGFTDKPDSPFYGLLLLLGSVLECLDHLIKTANAIAKLLQ